MVRHPLFLSFSDWLGALREMKKKLGAILVFFPSNFVVQKLNDID